MVVTSTVARGRRGFQTSLSLHSVWFPVFVRSAQIEDGFSDLLAEYLQSERPVL